MKRSLPSKYEVCSNSIKTEDAFTMTEMNKELNTDFLQNPHIYMITSIPNYYK